jgi:DNA modification methylase
MRASIADASIDMIYCDPPFGNRQEWKGKAGSFSDNWQWDGEATRRWTALSEFSADAAQLIAAITPDPRDRSYLAMMAELLIECRRVLRPTGTLWLHFDDTMGAHLRVLGDVIFGPALQFGTVIWRRTSSHNSTRAFGRVHDTIACFGRSRAARWRLARCRGEFVTGDPCVGVAVEGFAEDKLVATAKERVGYPTQKPVALLERIIRCGALPGDTVLDPTCGSGTTLVAAQRLGRAAIGIDISADAIAAAAQRVAPPPAKPGPAQLDMFAA